MGRLHARFLRDLGYDVRTVDPNPDAGADFSDVAVGMWRNAAAVVIAVPIEHAAEEAARWRSFNGRLLLEKPMARTSEEALALCDELANVRTGVGYVERFNPAVRRLRHEVAKWDGPTRVVFGRWNDRPSWDVELDLRSHDIDLARWCEVEDVAEYHTSADSSIRQRFVHVHRGHDVQAFNLMHHDANPLCAEWHALLTDSPDVASMQDAVEVLTALGR